ncbi:hypothetical protein A2635_00590 [Candidatus Peribacteria bacterium RIFCSPHIGHO2_01_FULL_51_9]|nr:MAG: hypothetical protein A2635_00590 [Candidatus Peribacteria bacterium RIFCSPHIGHO2_01_FULL_51_9]
MDIEAKRAVRRIVKIAAIVIGIAIILLWFVGGGIGLITKQAGSLRFTNVADFIASLSSTSTPFHFPWEVTGPQISLPTIEDTPGGSLAGPAENSASSDAPSSYGNPSPHAGEIAIRASAVKTQTASGQYLELRAAPGNGAGISISGWSLQSALTGKRAYIPEASPLFVMGRINTVGSATLAPGAVAIIVTGPSPVGVSLRENMCTGYLGTVQSFVPSLPPECPAPLIVIPRTSANESRLGASCFQYLSSLPPCTFPANPPNSLSVACRAEIQNALSYNGCVNQNKNASGFLRNSWRLYLAQGVPLWDVEHDIIRLLDGEGRIVNAFNY